MTTVVQRVLFATVGLSLAASWAACIAPTAADARPAEPMRPPVLAVTDSAKPFAVGTITIDPSSIVAGSPDIVVAVHPNPAVVNPSVTIAATGRLLVDPRRKPVGEDALSTVEVAASAPTGPGVITATLTAVSPLGVTRSISDRVWVDSVAGTTLVSASGTQDLQLKVIAAREAKGLIDAETAAAERARALGGPTSSSRRPLPPRPAPGCASTARCAGPTRPAARTRCARPRSRSGTRRRLRVRTCSWPR